MPGATSSVRALDYVVIVSNNSETLDGLQKYLATAGISCHSTRALHDPKMTAPPFATAVVIFPDDFPEPEIVTLVRDLRSSHPKLLTLLVSREPDRFRACAAPNGRSRPPILLPKPAFGWDILDAIHAHSAESRS